MLEGDLCLFWATLTHMLFVFGHELFLHVVFAEATGLDSNTVFALLCIFLFVLGLNCLLFLVYF